MRSGRDYQHNKPISPLHPPHYSHYSLPCPNRIITTTNINKGKRRWYSSGSSEKEKQQVKPRNYYKCLDNQRHTMEEIYTKLKLQTLEGWLEVTLQKVLEHGASPFLPRYYSNNLKTLLLSLYPNYPWCFLSYNSNEYFKSIEKQREFMQEVYVKLNLSSLDDWLKVTRNVIIKHGGKSLIRYYYNNDMVQLLIAIYPSHPWRFPSHFIHHINPHSKLFSSIDNQRQFLDDLYTTLHLTSLDDWLTVSSNKIIQHGGKNLIEEYNNDRVEMMKSIYPSHRWSLSSHQSKDYFKSVDNQRRFLDDLFIKLKLKAKDDWMDVANNKISEEGGRRILRWYRNDKMEMLRSIYPSHPWPSLPSLHLSSKLFFSSIDNQRQFLDDLFITLHLTSLDDWLTVSSNKIIQHGGKKLIEEYNNDRVEMMKSIYPSHRWSLPDDQSKDYFKSVDNQRRFLDDLFIKLKLKAKDDWMDVAKKKIIKEGGGKVMREYGGDMKKMLERVYPNHRWSFPPSSNKLTKQFLSSLDNQRHFLNQLFDRFHMKSKHDWLSISPSKIIRNGGKNLMKEYDNNMEKMLSSLYPSYPFHLPRNSLRIIDNQIIFMEKMKEKLGIKGMEEWKGVSRALFIREGGRRLLSLYDHNFSLLLSTLYPSHDWLLPSSLPFKYKPHADYSKTSFLHLKQQLTHVKEKYAIREKKDWYRINVFNFSSAPSFDLIQSLKRVYPNEIWSKKQFQLRSKKVTQRLLFSLLSTFFSSFVALENYRHPMMTSTISLSSSLFEFDVYFPSFNMAIEYQGAHHYDDIPSGFNYLELYQSRDKQKEILTSQSSIHLILVPYWWDLSLSSLLSTIHDKLPFLNPFRKQ